MKYWRQPRLGAICAFLYVLAFVVGTAYRSNQPGLPDTTKKTTREQNQILLGFAHQHGNLFIISSVLSVIGFALLIVTAFGLFHYMRDHDKLRIGRITLAVGVLGFLISIGGAIVGTATLISAANQYAAHHLSRTVSDFQNQGSLFSILDVVGSEAIAIWLGLTAVTLIRIQGNRSSAGWSTLAAAALSGIGFPVVLVLIAWSIGAGAGLWRYTLYGSPLVVASGIQERNDEPTVEEPAPRSTPRAVMAAAGTVRASRPAGRRGSAAKRRKH